MINKNNEHLAEAASVTVENARELMQTSLESIEKVAKLQLDASKKMLDEASQAIKEISAANNPKDFFERFSQLASHSVETNIGNCRDLYEVMQDVQTKMSKMIESNIQTSQKNVANAVQGLKDNFNATNSFGSGNNAASESVKNWINSANQAMANMSKMASQMSDLANSNIKAATTASAAAAKKATTTKK